VAANVEVGPGLRGGRILNVVAAAGGGACGGGGARGFFFRGPDGLGFSANTPPPRPQTPRRGGGPGGGGRRARAACFARGAGGGASVVKVPPPVGRTPICRKRSAPGKALTPKSSCTVNMPLLTGTPERVSVEPICVPAVAASNSANCKS